MVRVTLKVVECIACIVYFILSPLPLYPIGPKPTHPPTLPIGIRPHPQRHRRQHPQV